MSPWVPEPRPEPLLQESDAYTLGLLPPSTSVCSLGARGYGASVMLRLRGTEGERQNHAELAEGAGPGLGRQGMFVQL